MKKKLLVLFLALVLVLSFASCGKKVEEDPEEPMLGGWSDENVETTEDDLNRFNKATGLDLSIDQVKLISKQVVAGMNYRYEYTNEEGNVVQITIFEGLDGSLTVIEE